MTLTFHGESRAGGAARPAWITAIEPTKEDLARLSSEFGFDAAVLAHALDPNERPRVHALGGDAVLVLVRVPWFHGRDAPLPFTTVPLGLVIDGARGLTLCARDSSVARDLAAFVTTCEPRVMRSRVTLRALELTAEAYLACLDGLNRSIDEIEDRLRESLENREVLELLKYQKSLVYFTAALDAIRLTAGRIPDMEVFGVEPADREWLAEVLVELHQALDMAAIARDVLSSMMDAFASIISNNLNAVMKFLTSATAIMTLPVLLASLYGMNVGLPGARSPYAFTVLTTASISIAVIAAAYFRRRKWL